MKVEVTVLGSPSLIVWSVSVDIKQQLKKTILGALELCVKVEVDVLLVLINIISVDVKQH